MIKYIYKTFAYLISLINLSQIMLKKVIIVAALTAEASNCLTEVSPSE
jgi:hypothetical protein